MPEEKPITYREQWNNEGFIWCPECDECLTCEGDADLPEECPRCDWRPDDHADDPCTPENQKALVLRN